MKRDMTKFDAISEDGKTFHISAEGDFGYTQENYLTRRENEIVWKVIDLGLTVRPVGPQSRFEMEPRPRRLDNRGAAASRKA